MVFEIVYVSMYVCVSPPMQALIATYRYTSVLKMTVKYANIFCQNKIQTFIKTVT